MILSSSSLQERRANPVSQSMGVTSMPSSAVAREMSLVLLHVLGIDPDDGILGKFFALILFYRTYTQGAESPPAGLGDAEGKFSKGVGLDPHCNKGILGSCCLCLPGQMSRRKTRLRR